MKQITTLFFLFIALACAGQKYSIESVTGSTVALKETTIGADSLENVTYLTGAIDSARMETSLFGLIRAARTGQARAIRRAKEKDQEATALNVVLNAFSDSLYFEWTRDNHAGQFLASGQLPNYRIRIGSNFHWGRCYVAGNNLLRIELTDAAGANLNPRDYAVMRIQSPESFRLLATLSIVGEQVEYYLIREDTNRRTFEGKKVDGTTVRITQFLGR